MSYPVTPTDQVPVSSPVTPTDLVPVLPGPEWGESPGELPARARLRAEPVAPPAHAILAAAPIDPDPLFEDPAILFALELDDLDYSEPIRPKRRRRRRRRRPEPSKLVPLFAGYGVMLGIIVAAVATLVVLVLTHENDVAKDPEKFENLVTVGFDVLVALVVGIVTYKIGRIGKFPKKAAIQVAAWTVAIPVLAVLLAFNIGFAMALRELLKAEADPGPGLTLVSFLLICLEPALVEEWFFRHLALGTLRDRIGLHGAIWISAVMFGFAHLLQPLAIPYLIVLGAFLGYLRVWSGGLALPMLVHALHNAAVLMANKMM